MGNDKYENCAFSCHSGIDTSKETLCYNLESYSSFLYCRLIMSLTHIIFGVSALRVIVKKVFQVSYQTLARVS